MFKPFQNIWLKVIALGLGLLLWFHVATDKIYTYEFTLPLKEILLKDDFTLSNDPPESLTVMVSATGKQLMRYRWRERGIRINATKAEIGVQELNLTITNTMLVNATGVTLEEIVIPASVDLVVDQYGERTILVSLDLDFVPDEGFTVKRISSPDPSEIVVRGPLSVINGIDQIKTIHKELKNLRSSHSLTLSLVKPEGYGVTLRPDSVFLNLVVVPIKTRVFEQVPIISYNNPTNQRVTIDPPTVRVELTGPPDEIELLSRNSVIASINFTELDSTGRAEIVIDCPASFKVRRILPLSVRVSLE